MKDMRVVCCSLILIFMISMPGMSVAVTCTPTEPDMLGPFYKPDAPIRSRVGKGYVLTGTVRSAADCSAISGAKVEFWMAGPDGEYADTFRATLFSSSSGAYRLESHIPPPYYGRPQHIHILVSASGFRTLVTQHYPEKGKTEGVFDLVLIPEAKKQ